MVKTLPSTGTMLSRIEQGANRLVRLERDADAGARATRHTNDANNTAVTADPRAAVCGALAEPIDFPPLAASLVPGDHVAIAVDETVPMVASVVHGAVDSLQAAGVALDAISIVTADSPTREACRSELADMAAGEAIRFVVHDPGDANDLCFVGVTRRGEPLRISRAIYEADVVLPIGCARLVGLGGGHGVFDSLFPRFSCTETIARFRTPSGWDAPDSLTAARREADEAGWLLGVPSVMQVVPGLGGSVADVVAGEPRAVAQLTQQLCRRYWSLRAAQRASLVVATIAGGPQEQTWDNVARALAAAERLVADGGAVAICSELGCPPGKSLGRLVGSTDFEIVERKARCDHADDSWPAWQLARALQRGPVYLLSRLEADTVEDMGLAPVADVEELVRLAGRHESCIVLDDSQYTLVTVDGEE